MTAPHDSIEQFGYRQELDRVLSFRDILLFGIVFICPIAPFSIYGVVTSATQGHMALAYAIGMLAMILTAYSYGRMAGEFPIAGSTYNYAQRGIHPHAGFITGWMMFLDYVLVPLQINVAAGVYANALVPSVPNWVWVIIFATIISGVNLFGIKFTARVDNVVSLLMFLALVAFVVSAVAALLNGVGEGTLFSVKPFYNAGEFSLPLVMSGVGIAALSFLGFDAITTLSEEARNPRRDIGRAAILTCVIGALLFILQAYLATLAWPDFRSFPNIDSAFISVAERVGGPFLALFCSIIFIIALVAGGVVGQASACRLLYGMGRDEVIPKRFFAHLEPNRKVPTYNIIVMYVISIIGGVTLSLSLSSELVCFGAFCGFMMVNLAVIIHFFVRKRERAGMRMITNLAFPAFGFLVCLAIWVNMSTAAKTVGLTWLGIGVVYAAIATRGFKKLPPTLSGLSEADRSLPGDM